MSMPNMLYFPFTDVKGLALPAYYGLPLEDVKKIAYNVLEIAG